MVWRPDGEKIGMFIRFNRIHERVRQTDTAWRHRPRLCIASRGNKFKSTIEFSNMPTVYTFHNCYCRHSHDSQAELKLNCSDVRLWERTPKASIHLKIRGVQLPLSSPPSSPFPSFSLPSLPPFSFPFPWGPPPKLAGGLGSAVSFPSEVWGKAPADKRFGAYLGQKEQLWWQQFLWIFTRIN